MKPVRKDRNGKPVKLDSLGRKASAGCKGLFNEEMIQQVEMLALLGATQEQIAEFFNLHIDTITKWARNESPKYKRFQEALKRGKLEADMKVARGLYRRAVGFTYEELEVNESMLRTKEGKETNHKIVNTKRTMKYVVPDVKACIHWLRNRQRDGIWTEAPYKVEQHVKHSGSIDHIHTMAEEIPMDELTDKTKEMVFEVLQKQLAVTNREN